MVAYRFSGSHSAVRTVLTEKGQGVHKPRDRGKLPAPTPDENAPPSTPAMHPPDHAPSLPALPSSNPRRSPELRRLIMDSSIVEALVEFAEGRRDLNSDQVSAGFALLKKVLPDLANIALPPEEDDTDDKNSSPEFEIHIVDPKA